MTAPDLSAGRGVLPFRISPFRLQENDNRRSAGARSGGAFS